MHLSRSRHRNYLLANGQSADAAALRATFVTFGVPFSALMRNIKNRDDPTQLRP